MDKIYYVESFSGRLTLLNQPINNSSRIKNIINWLLRFIEVNYQIGNGQSTQIFNKITLVIKQRISEYEKQIGMKINYELFDYQSTIENDQLNYSFSLISRNQSFINEIKKRFNMPEIDTQIEFNLNKEI